MIRAPVSRRQLRAEVERRLPFDAQMAICEGRDILRLMSRNVFTGRPVRPDMVRFVGVLCGTPCAAPQLPLRLPSHGQWLMKVIARDGQFVFGLYRRHLKVAGYLSMLERLFGVPATTRNWNTITAIRSVLDSGAS